MGFIMVKHVALSKSHVYQLLRSKDPRVRRAAFTLLERSNPRLRTNSELFVEIARFIWDANPSYDVYREFTKRYFQAGYRVHELISAAIDSERQHDNLSSAIRLFVFDFYRIQSSEAEEKRDRPCEIGDTARIN